MEKETIDTSPIEATQVAIEKLREAKNAVSDIVTVRAHNKLSFRRAANVVKELNDLIRVLSIYNRDEVITNL